MCLTVLPRAAANMDVLWDPGGVGGGSDAIVAKSMRGALPCPVRLIAKSKAAPQQTVPKKAFVVSLSADGRAAMRKASHGLLSAPAAASATPGATEKQRRASVLMRQHLMFFNEADVDGDSALDFDEFVAGSDQGAVARPGTCDAQEAAHGVAALGFLHSRFMFMCTVKYRTYCNQ